MKLLLGNCLEVLKTLPDNSIDSVVSDPPYGLKFMGKKWDYDVPSVETWREVMRVLKPGGHALIACGTRTQHRMALNIEDAGFEIRDVITWLYGSGFPKSLDISKAIDKSAGAEREVIGKKSTYREPQTPNGWDCTKRAEFETAPSTDAAKEWQGWGTALKPACEFWTLARKPLSESTVAKNVLKWGVGGINVDGCRIASDELTPRKNKGGRLETNVGEFGINDKDFIATPSPLGRFPANLILDEQAAFDLDAQSGISKSVNSQRNNAASKNSCMSGDNLGHVSFGHNDSGGASRFFYCAKASKSERNAGLEGMPNRILARSGGAAAAAERGESYDIGDGAFNRTIECKNHHPTVKPIKLMEYLCRLITPPSGTVLDPFMGSGSTGVAAKSLGFNFVGIELDKEYFDIANARINGKIRQNIEPEQVSSII